jgi:hypothetical protein
VVSGVQCKVEGGEGGGESGGRGRDGTINQNTK